MQARNLKRYINQLTYAKAQCERRINILKAKSSSRSGSPDTSNPPGNDEDIKSPLESENKQSEDRETLGEFSKSVKESPISTQNSLQMLPGRKVYYKTNVFCTS